MWRTIIPYYEYDKIRLVADVDNFAQSLIDLGVDVEYKKFAKCGHGFDPGVGTDADGWLNDALEFRENIRNRNHKAA